jgi:hypothetical protein
MTFVLILWMKKIQYRKGHICDTDKDNDDICVDFMDEEDTVQKGTCRDQSP